MKYTSNGYSQENALKLGLNNDDLFLLRWFVDFSHTGKMDYLDIDKNRYYWINYKTVCEELPMLAPVKRDKKGNLLERKLKKDTLYRKFTNLCDAKVLIHHTEKKNGTYSYFAFGENFYSLVSDSFSVGYGKKSVGGTEKNPEGVRKKIRNKDSSLRYNSSTRYNTTTDKNETNVVVDIFTITSFYDRIKNKIGVAVSKKAIEEMIQKRGETEINKYIDNWDKFSGTKKKTVAGFFKNAVMDSYVIPESDVSEGKVKEEWEREYSDEDYDSLYENGDTKSWKYKIK